MSKAISSWLHGWRILARFTFFCFVLSLIATPLQLAYDRLTPIVDSSSDRASLLNIAILILGIALLPFIVKLAATLSGEFTNPNAIWKSGLEAAGERPEL